MDLVLNNINLIFLINLQRPVLALSCCCTSRGRALLGALDAGQGFGRAGGGVGSLGPRGGGSGGLRGWEGCRLAAKGVAVLKICNLGHLTFQRV